ncbi:DUF4920 domain-containing protein [Shewanella avicenniae]|uniref:DUF4920 domain-containing protein n=1 Tax=Shewanella avicenniae TaxID=2814294 RepID=A0ABX7QQM8_9GAMM|nr:DUF4920 domain-containing protein [Shewanella avicenniae]QSX33178.1 DUF4920 domain-containing protein [Shewanella avicenniae]
MGKYLLGLLLLSSCAALNATPLTFGSGVDEQALTQVSTILATPKAYVGKQVTIRGVVTNVCEKRGCWMTVKSDQQFQELYIKVPDGEMVFPLSARGSEAIVTGKLAEVSLSLEKSRDYLAEQAKSQGKAFDVASVTQPIDIYQLRPSGVKILD